MRTLYSSDQLSDEALIQKVPGFQNYYTEVNGIKLHYVAGGSGQPLILLPGWPETWWAYHQMLPELATRFHVIAIDIRGMGSTCKPAGGYDKKNMAADIAGLVTALSLPKVHIAGHDIGASIAYSFAAQFPELTATLVLLDTPPLDENIYKLPMLPTGMQPYPWWLAFNQVKDLPEALLEGRMHLLIDYIFNYVGIENSRITDFDKAVYAAAYQTPEGIRAGNAWYQAFPQDVTDSKSYTKLNMPVLGIGGSGYEMLKMSVSQLSDDYELVEIPASGHFFFEEQPGSSIKALVNFLLKRQENIGILVQVRK